MIIYHTSWEREASPSPPKKKQKLSTIWFYLYETPEKTNLISSNKKWMSGSLGPEVGRGLPGNGHTRTFMGDGNILNLDCSDGYKYMKTHWKINFSMDASYFM